MLMMLIIQKKMRKNLQENIMKKPRIIISKEYPKGELFLKWNSSHKIFNYIIFVYLPVDFSEIVDNILSKISFLSRP